MRTNKVAVAELKNMHIHTDSFAHSDEKNSPKTRYHTVSTNVFF